jgi:molybdenum cofactor guanylyltransferase
MPEAPRPSGEPVALDGQSHADVDADADAVVDVTGVTGVVLLGGASRRYGSDKAMALHDGVPMVSRMTQMLQSAGLEPVVTVGGPDRDVGVEHWPDDYPGEGPLGGLLTALRRVPSPLAVVVACDLPYLASGSARLLVRGARRHSTLDAVVARTDRLEPLCGCYRVVSCLTAAETVFASGERSLQGFLRAIKIHSVVLADPRELRNVNRPSDHLAWEA